MDIFFDLVYKWILFQFFKNLYVFKLVKSKIYLKLKNRHYL